MKGVLDYQKMLLTTIEIIINGMGEGKSVEVMQKERVLKDYESYNTFLRGLDTNYWIGAIYQSIKGEFKKNLNETKSQMFQTDLFSSK